MYLTEKYQIKVLFVSFFHLKIAIYNNDRHTINKTHYPQDNFEVGKK